MHKGSCLCGQITFEVSCELQPPSACHCRECRKHTGHYEVFDAPTKTKLKQHIFTAEKGDYYEITDSLPQIPDPRSIK